MKKGTVFEQLRSFLESGRRNAWLKDKELEVYVRTYQYPDREFPALDIANVNAFKPGKGAFTRFLEQCETLPYEIRIENVLTDQFAGFFRRRAGYSEVGVGHSGHTTSFTRKPC